MGRAFGMCAGVAFTAACGLSQEYALPTAGVAVGISGGNGAGSSGGNTSGGNSVSGSGGNSGTTTNGPPGTTGNIGTGPGGNGPGGNGPGGNGPGGNGPGGGVTSSTGGGFTGGNVGTTGTGSGGMVGTTGGTGGSCATQLEPCSTQVECCPNSNLTCEKEASAGGSFCETQGCMTDAQCTNAQTICENGSCALNICGGKSGNGKYNSTCTSGTETGSCIPKGTGMDEYGICYAGGSSDAGCSESAPTTEPSDLCVAGQACLPNPDGPGELCRPICNPGFGGGGMAVCKAAGYSGGCFSIGSLGVCVNF